MLNVSQNQGLSENNLLEMALTTKGILSNETGPNILAPIKTKMSQGDLMTKGQSNDSHPSADKHSNPKEVTLPTVKQVDDKSYTETQHAKLEVKEESKSQNHLNHQNGNLKEKETHQNGHGDHNQTHGHDHNHQHVHIHEGYDSFKIPADWKKAQLHAQSRETKPELDEDEATGGMQPVCECCGYEISRKKIGLNVDVMDLGFLGSGFPLFYNYIKYCCLMLFSLLMIQGVPNLIINQRGNYCNHSQLEVFEAHEENKHNPVSGFIVPCPDSWLNRLSFANIIDDMAHKTNYDFHYSIGAILAQIVLSMLFRRSQRVIESKVDEDNSTPSDYTIMVENISANLPDTEKSLREIFEKYGKVMKVNLVYDINDLEEVEKKLERIIINKQRALQRCNLDHSNPEVVQIEAQIQELEHEEHIVSHNIIKTKFIGTAFISYEQEQEKKDAIENNPQNSYHRFRSFFRGGESHKYNESIYMGNRHLYVSEAPEPNDVDWEFAHVTTDDKIKSRIISFIKWALLSIASFVVIFLISYKQSHDSESILEKQLEMEKEDHAARILQANKNISFTRNQISPEIGMPQDKLLNEDRSFSLGEQEQNKGNRIMSTSESTIQTEAEKKAHRQHELDEINKEQVTVTALSFVISAIIVIWNKFALPIIIHKICDHEKWSTKTSMNISFAFKLTLGLFFNTALITFFVEIIFLQNIYAFQGGMIYNEFLVFIFNAVIPSLAWIIDPWKIIQDWKRRKELKKPQSVMTQEEANSLMENPSYSMGKRYADIMKTMWFTFFYSPIMPIGIPISLIGLIGYYFTDKYNLIFRRTVKESIGSKLSFEMVEFVEYSMIFHTFGQAFFKYFSCDYIDVGNCAMFIAVCITVVVLPMQKINELIFPISSEDDSKKYSEVVHTFDTDYDRENPITKKKAIQDFQEMRSKPNSHGGTKNALPSSPPQH